MKTLKNILATGALVLGLAGLNGCSEKYEFKGEIDGEKIEYTKSISQEYNRLTVTKPNGVRLEFYENVGGDSLIDKFEIYQNGARKDSYSNFFCSSNRDSPVVQEAQKQFIAYRAKILTFKEEKENTQEELEQKRANEFYHKRDSLALEALKGK